MSVENWDEFRTALQVAQKGTVSAAAATLGVHHATVIRHVDALEERLGVKLFQRHARGYTPTEAGEDLMKVASTTDDQLSQLVSRIKGRSGVVSGELVITTVWGLSVMLAPALAQFQKEHPDVKIRMLSDDRLFRLEYGEAHVALRAGPKPMEPDNIVQQLGEFGPKLCASVTYAKRFGLPKSLEEFAEHRFVEVEKEANRVPAAKWLRQHVPQQNFVFSDTERTGCEAAVRAGIGIGFVAMLSKSVGADLIPVWKPQPEWRAPFWLVTHVDLHRTPKVQAILQALKDEVRNWPVA